MLKKYFERLCERSEAISPFGKSMACEIASSQSLLAMTDLKTGFFSNLL
jgi:hypothetical protein